MKHAFLVLAYVLSLVGLTMLAISCASQAQFDAGHELAAAAVAATDPSSPGGADVTPEEQEHITTLYGKLKDAEGIDWKQLAATVGAGVAALIPGLRYGLPFILARIPNEHIIGADEAKALDKVSKVA